MGAGDYETGWQGPVVDNEVLSWGRGAERRRQVGGRQQRQKELERGAGLDLLGRVGRRNRHRWFQGQSLCNGESVIYVTNTGNRDSVSSMGKGHDRGQVIPGSGRYGPMPFKAESPSFEADRDAHKNHGLCEA